MKQITLFIKDKQLELQLASLVEANVDEILLQFDDSESVILIKNNKIGIKPTSHKRGKTKVIIGHLK